MPSVYDLKPRFIALLRPSSRYLASHGVTANQITCLACLLSIAYGVALMLWPGCSLLWALLPLFLFVRMALNAIDGVLAREFGQKSRLGALLNEMGDVIADLALYLPLGWLAGVDFRLVTLFVWLALLTEFAGLAALHIANRRYEGPMGKSDRAALIGVLGLLIGLTTPWITPAHLAFTLNLVLAASCLLMILTVFNRLRSALREPQA